MVVSVMIRFAVLVVLALILSIGLHMARAGPAVRPVPAEAPPHGSDGGGRAGAPAGVGNSAVGNGVGDSVVDLAELIEEGRQLYLLACVSCHGVDAAGVENRGPSLLQAGTASVDFYLSSGRMPMDNAEGQSMRKEPVFSETEQDAIVAYLATVTEGPEIPEIDPDRGDLALGQQIYTLNCAGCHNAAGSGGALGNAIYAPALYAASPLEVAEAIRVGPGSMPGFNENQINDEQLDAVVRYVEFLSEPPDPGGLPLGRVGPVPEGMVAWFGGMGLIVIALRWIGTRT